MHRALIVASAFLACTGCNTISGVGKDMQAVGGVLSKTADGVRTGKAKTTKSAAVACLPDSRVPSRPCPAAKPKPKTVYAAAAKPKPKTVAAKPKPR